MKVLNLVNLKESQIQYKISQFPDGQQDIVIDTTFIDKYSVYGAIEIKSRFNSFRDLELIICANKALRRLEVKEIHLYIPYLLGARSDREFQTGGNSYLVDVIAPIINAQNFESVTVLDVHSNIAAACIKNLKNKFIDLFRPGNTDIVIVSPDAGAVNRISEYAKRIEYKGDILIGSKHRDKDGKLTNSTIIYPDKRFEYNGKTFVIIDDIIDGGRTFINIAKELKNQFGEKAPIYLVTTHGIFSAGLKELYEYFDEIITTNSVIDVVKDTEFNSRNDKYLDKVRQINVF